MAENVEPSQYKYLDSSASETNRPEGRATIVPMASPLVPPLAEDKRI